MGVNVMKKLEMVPSYITTAFKIQKFASILSTKKNAHDKTTLCGPQKPCNSCPDQATFIAYSIRLLY
jgi:hypothetical protein